MNIGIILPNLELNQLAYETLTYINKNISSDNNYTIFFEDVSNRCIEPKCSVMNISEIWSFHGTLISTTLKNTKYSLKVVGNIQRVFHIWDLEFLRNQKNYIENLSIYRHPNLKIGVRSINMAKIFTNYTNRQPDYIGDMLYDRY